MADRIEAKYGPDQLWPPVVSKDLHQGNFRLGTGLYAKQVYTKTQCILFFKFETEIYAYHFSHSNPIGSC